jgi:P pilus assembly chaperone PapD
MPALRTIGLVILSAFAVAIGIFGFFLVRGLADEAAAKEAALKVVEVCGTVISTGSTQNIRVNIPGNYHMRFVENRIFIDGYGVPEGGLALFFSEESTELGPGSHDLSIFISNGRLVVKRI